MGMYTALPVMTAEVSARVEACHLAFWSEKLAVLRSLPGNPYQADIQQFGDALAFVASQTQNDTLLNRVGNISGEDLRYLDSIFEWYSVHSAHCRFDIVPSRAEPALLHALATRGFYQSGFYSALYGVPQRHVASPSSITIRAVLPEESEEFADLYLEGFSIPKTPELGFLHESIRWLVGKPDMYCLLASVDNRPAAMAILYIYEHVGYLATAATLPAFRGRGCQTVLLQKRINLADELGCDLIVGHAGVGTQSQYNMERVGLRIAYTKAIWTRYQ